MKKLVAFLMLVYVGMFLMGCSGGTTDTSDPGYDPSAGPPGMPNPGTMGDPNAPVDPNNPSGMTPEMMEAFSKSAGIHHFCHCSDRYRHH